MKSELSLGPLLFHWSPEQMRDFYFRIADEAPIDTVYFGEIICSKRAPFFQPYYPEVVDRLKRSGKKIVLSTLTEIVNAHDRELTRELCLADDFEVEVNNAGALYYLHDKPHRVGQYFNVYNEDALSFLVLRGASHITVQSELSFRELSVLAIKAKELGVSLEVQVFGRIGLALSARCYHARSHNRIKDNCQFVCGSDPDGLTLTTLSKADFLTINGFQTLSHSCLNLMHEIDQLQRIGIKTYRLSPQNVDMVKTAHIFRARLDQQLGAEEATKMLEETGLTMPLSNGFFHGKPGYQQIIPSISV